MMSSVTELHSAASASWSLLAEQIARERRAPP